MATGVHLWSQTAGTNATADTSINWAEGQAPSSINDSARALMARVADFYKDLGGLTTAGSSTAYTATSNRAFATAAVMAGSIIVIIPHATSGATPTLAVDGLTARQIRSATGTNIATGALIAGTPYAVLYVHASTEFILLGYSDTFVNLTSTGTLAVTGASTFTGAVTFNGGGALSTGTYTGAATFSGNLIFSGLPNYTNVTKAMGIAGGTTAQRSGSPTAGDARYNSTLNGMEYWNGTVWIVLGQAPTVTRLITGGPLTYTSPAGVVRHRVWMIAGAGGGGASVTNPGAVGTDTSFQVNATGTAWTAIHGNGGAQGAGTGSTGGAGGTGGTNNVVAGQVLIDRGDGMAGQGGSNASGNANPGGLGGVSPRGGAGSGSALNTAGGAAKTNSGSGGQGGGMSNSSSGSGGGSGEWVCFWVTGMTTATYTVGAGGNGGAAGTNAGGNGGAGIIIIEEFYA